MRLMKYMRIYIPFRRTRIAISNTTIRTGTVMYIISVVTFPLNVNLILFYFILFAVLGISSVHYEIFIKSIIHLLNYKKNCIDKNISILYEFRRLDLVIIDRNFGKTSKR